MAFFGLKHFSGYLKINAKLLTMIDKVLYNTVMDCTPASLVTTPSKFCSIDIVQLSIHISIGFLSSSHT